MKHYFYTDPLAAGWMAKHHNIQFERYYFFGIETQLIEEGWYNKAVVGWMGEDKPKFYIHPDSLHLLEPEEGDVGISPLNDWEMACLFCDAEWVISTPDNHFTVEVPNIKIIQREGKPFFWPESEEV